MQGCIVLVLFCIVYIIDRWRDTVMYCISIVLYVLCIL